MGETLWLLLKKAAKMPVLTWRWRNRLQKCAIWLFFGAAADAFYSKRQRWRLVWWTATLAFGLDGNMAFGLDRPIGDLIFSKTRPLSLSFARFRIFSETRPLSLYRRRI